MENVKSHILGFPRIGADREMKKSVELYWNGKTDLNDLLNDGKKIRATNWQSQKDAGLSYVCVGDFAWYDHVLNHSAMFGVIPDRFEVNGEIDLDTIFRVGRGRAPTGKASYASEMTKWFDTNYHYIVPELKKSQKFSFSFNYLFEEIDEAIALGHKVKPVLLGPVSYLYLSKCADGDFNKIDLLDSLLEVYSDILAKMASKNIEWVQIDEPITSFDLDKNWQNALTKAYDKLNKSTVKILLANYFGTLEDNAQVVADLSTDGVHIDCIRGEKEVDKLLNIYKNDVVSLGVVNGRNIWCNDLTTTTNELETYKKSLNDNQQLWIGSSCSLLHVPVDLECEEKLNGEIKSWLAFAKQKCLEVSLLADAAGGNKNIELFNKRDAVIKNRKNSDMVNKPAVKSRVAEITPDLAERNSPYQDRIKKQAEHLNLPKLPTTNIGSFPQTDTIRQIRRDFKANKIDENSYNIAMKKEIDLVVEQQTKIGLDVFVHGEPERNDMVEYFGELMTGYAFTQNGWVQSYGSRCVKPPIIYGDVARPNPMTIEWSSYAQSLTKKPMKGMLTGPVTMLFWSFVRDDIPRQDVCDQIAMALRDEVVDLESANINIIQIDEPAFREGLPLRKKEWAGYLQWAVRSFRISASGVKDETQIHTHMCYSEFNDIIDSIAAMDADVITIETSRSNMELLGAFENFNYPNDIGPGVYDIHSPNIPDIEYMVNLIRLAAKRIDPNRLWVNPDCGLKTRKWAEVRPALENMVKSAELLRKELF